VFTSRWALVEGYWNLGKRIAEENNFNRKDAYGKKIVQGLGESLGVSTSTVYYALQAFDKYPELDKLPEGKNISWNKLITKYLPEPKEVERLTIPFYTLVNDKRDPLSNIKGICRSILICKF